MPRGSESGALLAGVCSRLAGWLHWNAWAVRVAWLVVLLVKPVLAIAAYLLLAVAFRFFDNRHRIPRESAPCLSSPELAERGRRIDALERRLNGVQPGGGRFRPPPLHGSGGSCAPGSAKSEGEPRA